MIAIFEGTEGSPFESIARTGWNMENKLVTETSQGWPGAETWYSYDAFGRRVMKDVNPDPNGQNGGPGYTGGTWEFYFYGITGQKLMTTVCTYWPDGELDCSGGSSYLYFGSKLIQANGSLVVTDRLGSVRAKNTAGSWTQTSYFPYGEERTSTPDGTEKFGTYYRDGPGQDYAEQRYYNNGTGRFWSVDPGGMGTADPSDPTSLNRYAYVGGDPVNYRDPNGLFRCIECPSDPGDGWISAMTPAGTASRNQRNPMSRTRRRFSRTGTGRSGDLHLLSPRLASGSSCGLENAPPLLVSRAVEARP
jgi:RHS repeat-associated protein